MKSSIAEQSFFKDIYGKKSYKLLDNIYNRKRLHEEGLAYLAKYPRRELWRLVVDGIMHKEEKGWKEYAEREPGSFPAMLDGLAAAITDLQSTQLSIDDLIHLHQVCTHRVDRLNAAHSEEFRDEDTDVSFGLSSKEVTVEGVEELLNFILRASNSRGTYPCLSLKDKHEEYLSYCPEANKNWLIKKLKNKDIRQIAREFVFPISLGIYKFVAPEGGNKLTKRVQAAIDDYQFNIMLAYNLDDKLLAIVTFIYELEHLHPFGDANTRTFVNLLLNRLLLQNGFPPATFENPNRFGRMSIPQLVKEVKQAIQNTEEIILGRQDLFGFSSSDIPLDQQIEYNFFVVNLVDAINTASWQKFEKNTNSSLFFKNFFNNSLQCNKNELFLIKKYANFCIK